MAQEREAMKAGGKVKRSTVVKVFGREYRVRSDEKEETVQRVARYVDKQMHEVAKSVASADPLGVAVLVALNVAGEYLPVREDRTAVSGVTAEHVKRLIRLADNALSQSASGRSR